MSSLITKLRNLKDYRSTVDPKVKDKIIIEYSALVKYIAQKIASRLPKNVELDDLVSCGVIGLMDAIQKFDPSRDNKFKTYAEFRIRGAILDELRAQDWVPRSIREKAKTLERAFSKIEAELGRPATEQEVCDELKIDQSEFHDMVAKSKSVSLLNIDESASFSRGDKKLMMGLLDGDRDSNPFNAVSFQDMKEHLKAGIKALPEKQRLVLSLYYYEDLNLKEIGQVLDVTESRVSQLHTQSILRLRGKLRSAFEHFEDIAI